MVGSRFGIKTKLYTSLPFRETVCCPRADSTLLRTRSSIPETWNRVDTTDLRVDSFVVFEPAPSKRAGLRMLFTFRADFGQLTLVAAFVHTILHCARFTYGGQAYIIYETDTGRSGVIGCILLLPIVLPMKLECLRTKVGLKAMHVPSLERCYRQTRARHDRGRASGNIVRPNRFRLPDLPNGGATLHSTLCVIRDMFRWHLQQQYIGYGRCSRPKAFCYRGSP